MNLNNISLDVSELKGLHIPATPDFFPLALGWWFVIILIVILLLLLYFAIYAWVHSLRTQALRRLKQIKEITDNKEMLKSVNQLAKQVAIARFGREKIAPLYEDEWISFMNSLLQNELFSKDYVDLLHKNMYAKKQAISDDMRQNILHNYEKWIKVVLTTKKRR